MNDETEIILRAQIDFALIALKGIVFSNGGAVVALLAFVGQIWESNDPQVHAFVNVIYPGLAWFVVGTWSGIVSSGMAYVSQAMFRQVNNSTGMIFRQVSMAFSLCGLISFALGSYFTLDGFSSSSLNH